MQWFPSRYRAMGFTMTEILVSIAIIGMLLGMVVVGVSKFSRQGDQTVCSANLSQLHKEMLSYAQDHRSLLPDDRRPDTARDPWLLWQTGAQSDGLGIQGAGYLLENDRLSSKQASVLYCPSSSHPVFQLSGLSPDKRVGGVPMEIDEISGEPVGYPTEKIGYSYHYRTTFKRGSGYRGPKASDSGAYLSDGFTSVDDEGGSSSENGRPGAESMHTDGHNVVFLNGRVEWVEDKPKPDLEEAYRLAAGDKNIKDQGSSGQGIAVDDFVEQEKVWNYYFD